MATRAAILEAAADEFAEKGYELASARAVCARAGVNAALSSRYFGTKEDLYRTTAKSLFGDLGAPLAVLPEKMGSGDSPRVVISTPDSGDSPRMVRQRGQSPCGHSFLTQRGRRVYVVVRSFYRRCFNRFQMSELEIDLELFAVHFALTGGGDSPRMGNFNAEQWGQSPCGHAGQ